ncbi:TetR/AcrR family transcriptional regulator [Nocardia sp. NPDC058518]|uniref:TetR/AcrR family transcriptional regulator n=1 Tax=Nocardia sp. NPDC058518 TaxID=3346534 RepID=UPI003660C54A
MPTSKSAGTRKSPQQDRSEAMVGRIIDAGSRVLLTYGYAGASTNRIAAEAGVSPGSLYYYFSDKDGVVRGVLDRFLVLLGQALSNTTARLEWADRAVFLETADSMMDVLEENRRLLEILVDEAPQLVRSGSRLAIEERLREHMRTAFLLLGTPLRGAELDAACWLATQLCLSVPVRYILSRPPISRETVLNGLADQIGALAGHGGQGTGR